MLAAGCVTSGSTLVATGTSALAAPGARVVHAWPGLKYGAASLGQSLEVTLDEASEVLDDGGGRRFVRGFALPSTDKPYSISVLSFRQGTPADPAILYPEVLFLDAQFRVVRKVDPARFSYRKGMSGDGLHAVVFINDDALGERYLVITGRSPAESALGETTSHTFHQMPISVPVRGAVLTWMIPMGRSEGPTRMIASPTGRIELLLEPYRLSRVGEKN